MSVEQGRKVVMGRSSRDLTATNFVNFSLGLLTIFGLAACDIPAKSPQTDRASLAPPPMLWDHRPEAADWTTATLVAVSTKDASLAAFVPGDIDAWCPGYPQADLADRRAFWVGLLSAVARYESSWNPTAAGGGGRWIGLMQISPRSASGYGCAATSAKALQDGSANLQCAVEIMADQVGKDGLVAGPGNRGIGRDWMPLRDADKRAEMSGWTRAQPYCTNG